MNIIQAIFLGIIQGITEFFPVSSSGHLIAFRYLFGLDFLEGPEMLSFDIALHFGTLLAIGIYFFKDWISLIKNGFNFKQGKEKLSFKNLNREGKMFWYLVAATIPGALAGFLLGDVIENAVRNNILIIALALTVMGILLYIADKYSKSSVKYEDMTFKQALIVGISQAFAIIPGFSRSGTTMTTARFLKIDRESAAKFSFLLGTPIMAGAFAAHLGDIMSISVDMYLPFIIGIVTSFVVGILCIKLLMNIIKKIGFGVFAIYRFLLAAALVITYLVRL